MCNPNTFRNALLHLAQVMTVTGDWLWLAHPESVSFRPALVPAD
jgi:hypothetical protein